MVCRCPIKVFTATIAVSAGAGAALAGPVNMWDFNVFSRSTIGGANTGYGSSIQGAAGSVGSAWFSGFTGKSADGASPSLARAFYGGGDFTLSGSIPRDGISVAGTVYMNNASITGPVSAGHNLSGAGGSINGPVTLGGVKTAGQSLTVNGTINELTSYTSAFSLSEISESFRSVSDFAAGLTPTAAASNMWGQLIVTANAPTTVVNMNAVDLASAWGVKISGPGTVVINVLGSNVSFASKTWSYENGADPTTTLLNLNQASTFNLSGGDHNLSILAPYAATNFSSGVVTGNLVVGSLTGAGSVKWNPNGGFAGQIPAPGAASLFALATLVAAHRRRQATLSA